MAKVIRFKDAPRVISEGLMSPFKRTKKYFDIAGAKILQWAFLTFRLSGARSGHKVWRGFSQNTLGYFTQAGFRFRLRPGTDKSRTRRYSAASKMMQASGLFRNSFGVLSVTNRFVKVGTRHRLAKKIMSSGGGRNVLFVTRLDKLTLGNMFSKFYRLNLRF